MTTNNFTIGNAANIPLNQQAGSIPNLGTAVLDWMQPLVFTRIIKNTVAYQVLETTVDIRFWGVIQPLTQRALELMPIGERAWTWLSLITQSSPNNAVLTLNVDEVVTWNGIQTRVMGRKDYSLYGFIEMNLVQDWAGSGPPTL